MLSRRRQIWPGDRRFEIGAVGSRALTCRAGTLKPDAFVKAQTQFDVRQQARLDIVELLLTRSAKDSAVVEQSS